MPLLTLSDLRGGVNDTDPPLTLKSNEMTTARNIDFRAGALGSKRGGTQGIDMTASVFDGYAFNTPMVATFRHTPTDDSSDDELWGIDKHGNIDRRVGGVWQGGVPAVNDFVKDFGVNLSIANAVSLHGKLFIAIEGSQDRLVVWDGSVLRWAGFAQPDSPSVADSAAAGTYGTVRYFRIRYVEQQSGVVVRRSEPSESAVFTPDGAHTGAVITKPAGTEDPTTVDMEGQTHWEVEASLDNVLFYRIATVAIGTATYTDTTDAGTGYDANPLSENIGNYVPPTSAKIVAVDEDRLVLAGSYFTPADDAKVWWSLTPGQTGVGNDERLPTATNQYLTFDGLNDGGVTALVAGVAGTVHVFKNRRVHKMTRTGILSAAYAPTTESPTRGALFLSACAGVDPDGNACVYFLDPTVGLCRIGARGLEDLGRRTRNTWATRNQSAFAHTPRMVFYPALDQVWFSASMDSSFVPSLLWKYEALYDAMLFDDGLPATAYSFTLFPDDDGVERPVCGTTDVTRLGGGTSRLHFCDIGTTDNGTEYQAYGVTKPFDLGGVFKKFEAKTATVLAEAQPGTILVQLIRDFGIETKDALVDTTPVADETHVVRVVDDCSLAECQVVQVKFGDETESDQAWTLERIVVRHTGAEDVG